MPLFAVAFNSASTGINVANGVKTSVSVSCDGQEYKKDTYAGTVEQALEDTPCKLEENDISEPAANTRLEGGYLEITTTKSLKVMVVDGETTTFGRSAFKTPREILKQLNIDVHPEDRVMADLIISDFMENGIGQRITIERTPAITLEADGNTLVIRSNASTVEGVLNEKGIVVGPQDELTPTASAPVTTGMKVTIVRVKTEDVTENQTIPFGTVSKKDYGLYIGQSKVETEGSNGSKTVTYKVVYKNGAVASKTPILETVTQASQSKVVVTGAKPYGREDLWNIILEASAKYGVDPSAMYRVMMCESGGNVYSGAGSRYQGLFQWDGTFYSWAAKAGVPADYFNPRSQIFATAARVKASGGWSAWGCKP